MADNSTSAAAPSTTRKCPNCRIRMSSYDHEKHILCILCRGIGCDASNRCNICKTWSNDEFQAYLKGWSPLQLILENVYESFLEFRLSLV